MIGPPAREGISRGTGRRRDDQTVGPLIVDKLVIDPEGKLHHLGHTAEMNHHII